MPNLQRIYQRSLRFGPFSEDQHICFNVVGRFLKIASEWHGAFSASLRIFVADDSANWRDWSSIHSPHIDAVQGSFCWNERWSIGIIGRVSCLSGLQLALKLRHCHPLHELKCRQLAIANISLVISPSPSTATHPALTVYRVCYNTRARFRDVPRRLL